MGCKIKVTRLSNYICNIPKFPWLWFQYNGDVLSLVLLFLFGNARFLLMLVLCFHTCGCHLQIKFMSCIFFVPARQSFQAANEHWFKLVVIPYLFWSTRLSNQGLLFHKINFTYYLSKTQKPPNSNPQNYRNSHKKSYIQEIKINRKHFIDSCTFPIC